MSHQGYTLVNMKLDPQTREEMPESAVMDSVTLQMTDLTLAPDDAEERKATADTLYGG